MHYFKDVKDTEWAVRLDVSVVKDIRDKIGIDLHHLDEGMLQKITDDDEVFVDLISIICSKQIDHEKLDANGFAERMVGDTLDEACNALMDELVFISRRSRRTVVAKAWEKTLAAEAVLTTKAVEMLDNLDVEGIATKAMEEAESQLGSLSKTAK